MFEQVSCSLPRWKVVLVHNRYQQSGGEDTVFLAERELLIAAGHRVVEYTAELREVNGF